MHIESENAYIILTNYSFEIIIHTKSVEKQGKCLDNQMLNVEKGKDGKRNFKIRL